MKTETQHAWDTVKIEFPFDFDFHPILALQIDLELPGSGVPAR